MIPQPTFTSESWGSRARSVPRFVWFSLALSLLATFLGWDFSRRRLEEQVQVRLSRSVDRNLGRLRERLLLCEPVVHGARGLYAASKSVERGEWRVYGEGLFGDKAYPGIRALLSISFVANSNLPAFLKITRGDEAPGFAILPQGDRADYCPIKYIHSKGLKSELVGQDVGLIPALRESLMQARDSGTLTLSSPVALSGTETKSPETLLILPVYRNDLPKGTLAERRASLEGWVAALIPVSDLAAGLASPDSNGLDLQIFDDAASVPLLFESRPVVLDRDLASSRYLEKTSVVPIGGRSWRVVFRSGVQVASATEAAFPTLVIASGCAGSFLLFYLLCSLATTRANALKLAEEMTHTLRERDRLLYLTLESARMGVWEWDVQNDVLVWPQHEGQGFGLPPGQNPTTHLDFLQYVVTPERLRVDTGIRQALARKEPYHDSFPLQWPDGSIHWVDRNGSVHCDSLGQPLKIVGVVTDITERKNSEAEMEQLNQRLFDASHQAGMAEIATGVLHNVGNVLNSVNVSANLIVEKVRQSKLSSLNRATNLLQEHTHDLDVYLTRDPKGKQLLPFLLAISEQLTRENSAIASETLGLQQNIDHIKQIVAMQQSYARVSGTQEALDPKELMEDALRLSATALMRHQIEVVREFDPVPKVLVDRHKVLQILINLVTNAKQALDARSEGRRLTLFIRSGDEGRVRLEVRDNGVGIQPENLERVFTHGFTTKKSGHGFGLHSAANTAKEMGGSLSVRSDGLGTGATFILELAQGPAIPGALPSDQATSPSEAKRAA